MVLCSYPSWQGLLWPWLPSSYPTSLVVVVACGEGDAGLCSFCILVYFYILIFILFVFLFICYQYLHSTFVMYNKGLLIYQIQNPLDGPSFLLLVQNSNTEKKE